MTFQTTGDCLSSDTLRSQFSLNVHLVLMVVLTAPWTVLHGGVANGNGDGPCVLAVRIRILNSHRIIASSHSRSHSHSFRIPCKCERRARRSNSFQFNPNSRARSPESRIPNPLPCELPRCDLRGRLESEMFTIHLPPGSKSRDL